MIIFNKNYIKNKLEILSFIFIFYILFGEIIPVWGNVFELFLNKEIFNTKILIDVTDDMLFVHSRILMLGILLTIFAVIKKSIGIIDFASLLLISFSTKLYELMDKELHPLIFKTGILNYFLHENSSVLNPQYTRILFFLISFIALFSLILFKKTRTIDRFFIFLISGSILVTTSLFHIVLPMGMLKYAKKEKMEELIYQGYNLENKYLCKHKTCIILDKDLNEKKEMFIGDINLQKNNQNFINEAKKFFINKNNEKFPIYGMSGNFIGTYTVFNVCLKKENEYLCIIDDNAIKDYGLHSELWFAFLTSIAHTFWLLFGLVLLWLHKSKLIRKIVNNKINMEQKI